MSQSRKRKVAVLGGGLAGLTAAYELSESEAFDITVYQMGWRLGGKVASSRSEEHGLRIEEHGIHVLFGAYENTFHVLRRAYTELGFSWRDAFDERSEFTLMEDVDSRWLPWIVGMQRQPGDPGDALGRQASCASVPFLVTDLLGWLRDQVESYFKGTPLERPARWFFGGTLARAQRSAESVRDKSAHGVEKRGDSRWLLMHLRWNLFLIRVIGWVGYLLWTVLRPVLSGALRRRDNIRRLWIAAELAVATAAGLTKAGLQGRQVQDLDEQDLRDWLKANGVIGGRISRSSANSACLRMVYEVVFAYEGGDPDKPRLAAGTAVRDLLRLLFDRRGALAYTMRAGSAETMITPLYRALAARGVKFEFFHRIDRIVPSSDGRHIEEIEFTRQATALNGKEYDPLIDDGAWPDHPKYDLLVDGETLRASEALQGGRDLETPTFDPPTASPPDSLKRRVGDFDLAVLALPVEVLRTVCAPLAARDTAWRDMLNNSRTTPTQSVQLWFDKSAKELGWNPADATEAAMLGAYAQPFGNWLDLSTTLRHERWRVRGFAEPASVAYLCGPLNECITLGQGREGGIAHVRHAAERWMSEYAARLWPAAYGSGGLALARLIAGPTVTGNARYEVQFFRANTNPSDRYTLTLPGSTRFRLAPDDSGFTNLYLAGDWTANGFDVGCVEATVMSGRLAARAVRGLRAAQMPVYGEVPLPRHHASHAVNERLPDVFVLPTRSSTSVVVTETCVDA